MIEKYLHITPITEYLPSYNSKQETGEMQNACHVVEAHISNSTVSANIPEEAWGYYFEFSTKICGKRLVSTTSFVQRLK